MLYQSLRRSCLTLAFVALLVVPVWHLGRIDVEGAGLAGEGRWAGLARELELSTITPPVLGTPWSIEVLGVEFLDPLAGLSLLSAGRAGPGVLLALVPTVLAVALLGRFFCGWLCPYVPILAASNAIRGLVAKVGIALPDKQLGRATPFVVLLSVLLLTVVGGSVIAPLVYPPSILGRQLFRAVYFGSIGGGVVVIVLAFALDTFVSRVGFCRFLCPGGALFRIIGVASPVRVKREIHRCDDCGDCDLACSLGQSPMTDRLDSGCERCGKCVAACPRDALRLAPGRPAALISRGGREL
jgi:ferredoxin-type protein NapH